MRDRPEGAVGDSAQQGHAAEDSTREVHLALWQNQIERILADWVGELAVPVYRGREVTGFAQDDAGVHVELSDGQSLRAGFLAGCDGGRSRVRKAAGIEFPGWDPSTSVLIAAVKLGEEPEWGLRSPPAARCGSSPCCTTPGRCYSTSASPAASTSPHGPIGSS